MTSFAIAYDRFSRWVLSLFGMGPRRSGVWIGGGRVQIRLGWAFRLDASASSVTGIESVKESVPRRFVAGVGVHGWGRSWRVNGATDPIVRIRFDPWPRARVIMVPLRVHTVEVSVEDTDGLIAALAPGAP